MSDFNATHNRAVWFDIPVADLDRAVQFYREVLAVPVSTEQFGEVRFGLISHGEGNGGCLVENVSEITSDKGFMVYVNADGRLRDAVAKVTANGGKVLQEIHSLGPHGCRAVVLDSEGNRFSLHSKTDA